jgi:hypothetical protein
VIEELLARSEAVVGLDASAEAAPGTVPFVGSRCMSADEWEVGAERAQLAAMRARLQMLAPASGGDAGSGRG